MVEIIWEFIVKEEARGQFELVYGPGGAWSTVFGRCPGFRGTTLLRDAEDPRRYLTIELWDSEEQRDHKRIEDKTAYADLETSIEGWTDSITALGTFRVLAEATVRPSGQSGRRKIRGSRRRNQ